jgi:glycosyltransferase involved in cell wall biosynthesis
VAVDFFTALAAKMASVPCVVTRPAMVSHLEFPRPIKRMYRCMDRMTFRWAARVVAVSESGRDILSADGCATTKLEVIHNGTDIHRFHPGVRPRDDLEGPPSWGLNIAVVGTMKSIKRHDRVMQAAAMARTHGRRWRLIFAGDGPERLTLEALAAALGIQDQVRFLGFVEDMPAVYAACDLAALPSLREGMPMTLMEAMACGKPVVASEVGGVAELVGRAGVLLKKADAESLYAAFRHLEDREIRRRMGRIGREQVLAHYRVEDMIKKLEDLYLSCVHLP